MSALMVPAKLDRLCDEERHQVLEAAELYAYERSIADSEDADCVFELIANLEQLQRIREHYEGRRQEA